MITPRNEMNDMEKVEEEDEGVNANEDMAILADNQQNSQSEEAKVM